ncbi:glycosyltransferase family 4 protein [Ruegeria arenilitoris]|uniref:glycosyltransferase family 4 protein n=1 Tax=Ruegeria arenilitoris TaxID=1173585 RepID=UPI00147BA2C8
MKILIVQGGFGAGGAEKIVSVLAAHRIGLGDQVSVAGMTMPEDGSYFSFPDGVSLLVAEGGNDGFRRLKQLARLRRIRRFIQDENPDVVVSFLTKINVLTLAAALRRDVPVIVSERNNPIVQNANPVWRHAQNILGHRASTVVMQTERVRQDLPPSLRSKAQVIPNPCAPIEGAAQLLGSGGNRLVAVGRLDPQKGFDLLIDAMSEIIQKNPDARLTIFGEGPERAALEAQRDRLGLQGVISLPGASDTPGAWMKGADILVFSSRFEGFPNVVAEATVAGLPVVSFDCPYGPKELIRHGENGLLVAPENTAELARAVLQLSDDPELLDKMRQGYQHNRDWLAPDSILEKWDRIIADAAHRRVGAGVEHGHSTCRPES